MLIGSWAAGITLLAVSHILAEFRNRAFLIYITKPATMLLVIGMLLTELKITDHYGQIILSGMLLSLAGDIFLMLRAKYFLAGLFCFLAAHLAYLSAFLWQGYTPSAAPIFLLGIIALSFYIWIRPSLMNLKFPVIVYMVVLAVMAATAFSGSMTEKSPASFCAAAGAALFVFSDICLAVRQFRCAYAWSPALIMAPYFAAQTLIAFSVFRTLS